MNRRLWLATLAGLAVLALICGCGRPPRDVSVNNPATQPPADMRPAETNQAAPSQAPTAGQPSPAAPAPAAAPAAQPQQGQAAAPAQSAPAQQAASSGNAGASADWPNFRGPNLDGISPDRGISKNWASKPPREIWRAAMSDRGYSGPSVAEGKVFIIDHRGDQDIVRAIDLATGKDAWSFAYPDTSKENYGFARSTPTYAQGRIYTLSRLGVLHCLDAKTGAKIWLLDVLKEYGGQRPKWDYAASPLVDGDRIILCPGGQTGAVALDRVTGKTLWTGGVPGPPGYATPVPAKIAGRQQYVIFGGTALYGVDVASGKTLWQTPWQTSHDVNAATPVVIGDSVFITSGYNVGCGMVKVSGSGAQVVWKNADLQSHFNSPVHFKGHIYGIGDPGNLVCIEPKSGRAVWKHAGFQKGGLVVVEDVLIAVNGGGGDVVMVKASPDSYQELGRIRPLGGQSWTAPIIAQGKLIVRNTENLACLDLR